MSVQQHISNNNDSTTKGFRGASFVPQSRWGGVRSSVNRVRRGHTYMVRRDFWRLAPCLTLAGGRHDNGRDAVERVEGLVEEVLLGAALRAAGHPQLDRLELEPRRGQQARQRECAA